MQQFAARAHPEPSAYNSSDIPVVFVIDDDSTVRESLGLLITCAGWQARVFPSAAEFLGGSRPRVPSCLVLNVAFPHLDGLELQRLLGGQPELPIIFMAGFADVRTTVVAMKAGAFDFLTRPFADETLSSAIRHALEVSRSVMLEQAKIRALRARYESLSPRQQAVMAGVVAGLLNKQVGRELGISEGTVKVHRCSVMSRMHADSLPALVHMAATLDLKRSASRISFSKPDRPSSIRSVAFARPAAC